MTFPVLRFTAGVIIGAAGLMLIGIGAAQSDLAIILPGVALIGPLAGFFVGEANGRRPPPWRLNGCSAYGPGPEAETG